MKKLSVLLDTYSLFVDTDTQLIYKMVKIHKGKIAVLYEDDRNKPVSCFCLQNWSHRTPYASAKVSVTLEDWESKM